MRFGTMKVARSGPGDFAGRLKRASSISASDGPAAEPLAFMAQALQHQLRRAETATVMDAAEVAAADVLSNGLVGQFPLLDMSRVVAVIGDESRAAVDELQDTAPGPLRDAGLSLAARPRGDYRELIQSWTDDTLLLDPRLALWIRIGAGPIVELAAAKAEAPSKEEWAGGACPICGDVPQCSAIVEESGGFLQGAPRYLVCARCSSWWVFPRAKCPSCGEDDSRRISSYVTKDHEWARIDACDTCRGYIKSFDLREKGAIKVVPLVDDVATLTLDVWAHEQGLTRLARSMAGV